MKTCNLCKASLPLDGFYKRTGGGYTSYCRKCLYLKNRESKVKRKDEVAQYMADYAAKNKEKIQAYLRDWREKNKERLKQKKLIERDKWLEYNKRYHAENREKVNARQRAYKSQNRHLAKAYYEATKEQYAIRRKQWAAENKALLCAKSARRRAAMLQAVPSWANADAMRAIYEKARDMGGMHVDHIVPLQSKIVCGLHCEANLQILTPYENMSKNNRHWPDMP